MWCSIKAGFRISVDMTLITIFVFFCCVDAGIKETFVLSAEELKEKKIIKRTHNSDDRETVYI